MTVLTSPPLVPLYIWKIDIWRNRCLRTHLHPAEAGWDSSVETNSTVSASPTSIDSLRGFFFSVFDSSSEAFLIYRQNGVVLGGCRAGKQAEIGHQKCAHTSKIKRCLTENGSHFSLVTCGDSESDLVEVVGTSLAFLRRGGGHGLPKNCVSEFDCWRQKGDTRAGRN